MAQPIVNFAVVEVAKPNIGTSAFGIHILFSYHLMLDCFHVGNDTTSQC